MMTDNIRIKITLCSLIIVVEIIMALIFSKAYAILPVNETLPGLEQQRLILKYINEYRVKSHLTPLVLDSTISKVAAEHSQNMASHRVPFGHQNFDRRINQLYKNIKGSQAGAENIAHFKIQPQNLVNAWIKSPGHRRNIKGHYNLTGIGIAYDKKGWAYFTQIFLRTKRGV